MNQLDLTAALNAEIAAAFDAPLCTCHLRAVLARMPGVPVAQIVPDCPTHPAHTCYSGALCAYWYALPAGPDEPPDECGHYSCRQIVHEQCAACFAEDMAAEAGASLTPGKAV